MKLLFLETPTVFLVVIMIILCFSIEDVHAQDWARLNGYKEENTRLSPPSVDENRIVFFGNSITIGWLHKVPEFFEGKPYINRGIGGQTTPQMLVRFRPDVIDLQPKVVVILAGTNDIAGNTGPSTLKMIADNIFSMCELAEANHIKVVISSVLPVYDYPWEQGLEPAQKIIDLNALLKKYAVENGHVYVDYFIKMVDSRNGLQQGLTYDGVHPDKAGYEIMGPLVETAILNALSVK